MCRRERAIIAIHQCDSRQKSNSMCFLNGKNGLKCVAFPPGVSQYGAIPCALID